MAKRSRGKLMSSKELKEVGFDRHHAVVIGAGMAGLAAGRIFQTTSTP